MALICLFAICVICWSTNVIVAYPDFNYLKPSAALVCKMFVFCNIRNAIKSFSHKISPILNKTIYNRSEQLSYVAATLSQDQNFY